MERYPKITKLISNIDIENYPAYKECVKGVAEITAFDVHHIPFLWEEMLSAVLKSCNINVEYDTKQAVSNWIDAASMWNADVYAPLAKEGYYPFPVSGDYYDFGFSRELGYLSSVTSPYMRSYIQAIALFEILRFYVQEEMRKPIYDEWGKLIKNELSFEESDMWHVILGSWPVHIDWNFYDLQFDGKDFTFFTDNQSRKLDKILNEKLYRNIETDGFRYRFPAYEFIVGSETDEKGMVYSADGRVLLRCNNKTLADYIVKDGTCIICSNVFPKDSELNHIKIPKSVVFMEDSSFGHCKNLRTVDIEGEGLEVIGAYAFSDSESLWKIKLPESVTDIDEGAFFDTQIERFYVGKHVVHLSGGIDENEDTPLYSIGGENTISIEVHQDNPIFCSIDGMLYSKDQKILYACPEGRLSYLGTDTITVPNGTEVLYDSCLEGIKNLKKVILPSSIQIIGNCFVFGGLELVLWAPQPPKIGLDNNLENMIVRVPGESVELYRNDENWRKIKTKCIIGIDDPLPKAPSKEEISAISLWKNGLGDMSKYFSGEDPMPKKTRIATADSWKILPMPDKYSIIRTNIQVPAEAMDIIRKGHIPEAMEDHWFMYCDDSAIRYYRSWTGIFAYEAHYEKTDEGYKITSLKVNRSPNQYGETNDRRDYCLFMYLLLTEAGGDGSEFFDEYLSLR
jgi:hypothetical protein